MVKVKRNIVVLIQSTINYMFHCHVFFIEHIPFFSIPFESHNIFESELVHIDNFLDEIDSFLVDTGTLVLDHHASSSFPMVTSTPYETIDPSPYVLLNVFVSLLNYHILFISLIHILLYYF